MKLQAGDVVSVVAPASQFGRADRCLLDRGVALLESWGLRVRVRVEEGHHFYLAGPDAARARHLREALLDPETRAIFCTRGGYGSARLLPRLEDAVPPSPRLLVGYSDVTTLHLAAQRFWPPVRCLHGPNLATRQLLADGAAGEGNRAALRAALFEPQRGAAYPVSMLTAGTAAGPLQGGCLSLIAASLGTPVAPRLDGAVLFFEDTGEAPYRIDRMLTQCRLAGILDGVEGIVFGVVRGCVDPYNDLRAVVVDLLGDLGVPIAFDCPCGHGDANLPLRLGVPTTLDGEAALLRQSVAFAAAARR